MPLVRMGTLLRGAARHGRCVGAFSVANLEMILGAVRAAEAAHTPIILQIAEARLATSPLAIFGPTMVAAASGAAVDIAVHLDHGLSDACMQQALALGFTSVMFDGSHLTLDENIDKTCQVMAWARASAADVEAEIGRVGRTEDGKEAPVAYAEPADALRFLQATGVDALAVGIGNAHGVYVGTPRLRLDILADISAQTQTPLVLHGGTGITPEDFRGCIDRGVRKINIATASFHAAAKAAHDIPGNDLFTLSRRMADATQAVVTEHLHIFGLA